MNFQKKLFHALNYNIFATFTAIEPRLIVRHHKHNSFAVNL